MTELYIEPERKPYNPTNGRFLKGSVPHNKGRKMAEWMDGRKMKRVIRIATENLRNASGRKRPDVSERCRKPVVGIYDGGRFKVFASSQHAAERNGCDRSNVSRCCRLNASHGTNTDHRYKGIRFYFENDDNWTKKIAK